MRIIHWLNRPTQPQALGLFRIFFGLIILWDIVRIKNIQLIDSFYVHGIVFPYDFLPVPLPGEAVMHALLNVLFISALLITLGLFYRIAMTVFAVGFSYF